MSATTLARAWAITRRDGLVLGFTDHDGMLDFAGIRFRPDSGLTARAIVQTAGLAVDNSEAEGALTDDAISEADLMAGLWDGAELHMWEVDWTNPAARRLVFRGSLGEVARANGAFRAEMRGLSEPLNTARGRRYHPRCSARLGDGQCKVDLSKPGLSGEGVLETVADGDKLVIGPIGAFDQGWFERGVVEVLDGAAKGQIGRIKNDRALPGQGRAIDLWDDLGLLPQAGDHVRLTAGCDKHSLTCRLKFDNFLNFRGFPHLPNEDWLMSPDHAKRQPDVRMGSFFNAPEFLAGGSGGNE